jgi:SAM-dependent methyltransferase
MLHDRPSEPVLSPLTESNRQLTMDVFVSWSGNTSHKVAISLKSFFEKVLPSVRLWTSDDLPVGTRWTMELAQKLNDFAYGIVVMTSENLNSPWIYFECGALSKAMQTSLICPYLFDIDPSQIADTPLAQFHHSLADEAGTKKLVYSLNEMLRGEGGHRSSENLEWSMKKAWEDLEKELEDIRTEESSRNEIIAAETRLNELLSRISETDPLVENQYLRLVLIKSLTEFGNGLNLAVESGWSYAVPYILYPKYLISLLKKTKAQTKAIAIVDNDEAFWPQREGREILLNTHKESTRVFAFRSKSHLTAHLQTVIEHAQEYDVFVLNYDSLVRFYPDTPYDFAIIGDINSTSLLAVYDDENFLAKRIKFTANTVHISRHHDMFTEIRDAAVKVDRSLNWTVDGDRFVDDIFSRASSVPLTQLAHRHIEMSSYIHPHEYHLHEEKHAYYIEMREQMIEICKEHSGRRGGSVDRVRALELGAGTGLFTTALLSKLPNIDLTAIEIDWACYLQLLEDVLGVDGMIKAPSEGDTAIVHDVNPARAGSGVKARLRDVFISDSMKSIARCVNADARTYNPPGTFSYIFSSFADHHIKTYDKAGYFANVKRNLSPGGIAIVGDEFLPPYDKEDIQSREQALYAYHGHIIEETRKKYGNDANGLIQLEEAALESGLKGIGDFKLSCELYEEYLNAAGFRFQKDLIGPADTKSVGGVYVYTLSV